MSYAFTSLCTQCNDCLPLCPTNAIKQQGEHLWIDPMLCNNCEGFYDHPLCASICLNGAPVPLQAKKGRCKVDPNLNTSPRLFGNGKTHSFASAIVIWEACNVLAQRQSLSWQSDSSGYLCHRRLVSGGRAEVTLCLADTCQPTEAVSLTVAEAEIAIANYDLRAACLHLLFAAYATSLDQPWEETFTISDQDISAYLGLDKRKDLNKLAKLTLIKDLVEQPCKLLVTIDWSRQDRFRHINVPQSYLWHLVATQPHFQTDHLGSQHLTGMTFTIKPGAWTQFFLNRHESKSGTVFYQYGTLPKSLLTNVMSIWQQYEGAARMMLWLLFKTRMGAEQRITVTTLMRIGYGEQKLLQAATDREKRKRLLKSFESDLEVLHHYHLKPVFDPVTYPVEIQPLWAKLADVPDDAEAALEFWTNDGNRDRRLTDAAPRDKWHRLMQARFLCFELPADWEASSPQPKTQKSRSSGQKGAAGPELSLSSQQIIAARKSLRLSQRDLASHVGKSQSWVRDIESGRMRAGSKDQQTLVKVLGINQAVLEKHDSP